jgi:hypothetical protein
MQAFPKYVIYPIPLQEIQIRLGKVLDRKRPSEVIQEEEEEEIPIKSWMTLGGKMLLLLRTKNPSLPKMNLHKLIMPLLIQNN